MPLRLREADRRLFNAIRSVKEGKAVIQPLSVTLDVETRSIKAGPAAVTLQPVEFVIYHELARARLDQCGNTRRLVCGDCMACYLSVEELRDRREKMLQLLGRLYRSGSGRLERVQASWSREQGLPPEVIRSHIADMNRRLKESGLDYLRVASNRQYGSTRYGLKVDKRVLQVRD